MQFRATFHYLEGGLNRLDTLVDFTPSLASLDISEQLIRALCMFNAVTLSAYNSLIK